VGTARAGAALFFHPLGQKGGRRGHSVYGFFLRQGVPPGAGQQHAALDVAMC